MKRIRRSPEQIIRKLRRADAELARGTAIPEIRTALGIAENTRRRGRDQFGGTGDRLVDLVRDDPRRSLAVGPRTRAAPNRGRVPIRDPSPAWARP